MQTLVNKQLDKRAQNTLPKGHRSAKQTTPDQSNQLGDKSQAMEVDEESFPVCHIEAAELLKIPRKRLYLRLKATGLLQDGS